MVLRLFKYMMQMFPPYIYIPVGFISFFASYYLAEITIAKEIAFDWTLVCGGITSVLVMLLLRVMDELKDYETDLRLMKDRPLVTGVVTIKDLRTFMIIITAGMFLVNMFLGKLIFVFFLITIIYCYLMFVYFFYPKISESLILAVVTHNPIVPIVQLYVLSFIYQKYGDSLFNLNIVLIIFLFWMPYLAWEFARKIRDPKEETDYVTYSKIFGYKVASLMALGTAGIAIGIGFYFIFSAKLSMILAAALALVAVHLIFRIFKFIHKPFSVKTGFKDDFELLILVIQVGFFLALVFK